MTAIKVRNLTKHYGKLKALKNISFEVKKGEIFGLLGTNGSGKSTLIHSITQLANITKGTIQIMGFDTKKQYLEAKKCIGLSPQEPNGDAYFPILQSLIYQGGYFGLKKQESKKRAEKLLKEFNLYDKRKEKFRTLSGGMKRKLSLVKAIIHKPDILILDEPTAALDVDARHELWEHVRKLNKEGTTIFLTTHYIEEAEMLCDRICILNKGKIVKIAPTKQLINDLSQNIIKITAKEAEPLKKYNPEIKNDEIHIRTTYKDQTRKLKEILDILDKENIAYTQFTLEPDTLENIFRRMVDE